MLFEARINSMVSHSTMSAGMISSTSATKKSTTYSIASTTRIKVRFELRMMVLIGIRNVYALDSSRGVMACLSCWTSNE